ncbi:GtrA family protein [Helicobacter sp. MIT 21-1697]|uniref:GtrA family protein n=1 Tax=Helicobacter sp. MIT 21-1697 TaxID=2993733 RepID=UPI00224A5FC1|nr:GtrA family protein [Helicobacter sp. MIT 21-1697]MCX2717537.1 GtrA family protein [Helicobacter sp. MIT 21-1697]
MSKPSWQKASIMYLGIGIINTCVGYGVIFALIFYGIMPEVANVIGYGVGFVLSYFLNKTFTFASPSSHKRDLPRFAFAMGVAYLGQFLVMSFAYRFLALNPYFAQIIGGAVYVCIGFVISKCWVFKQ